MSQKTVTAMEPTNLPSGYRPNPSGLIVPDEVSRIREVVTAEEWALVSRVVDKVCRPRNMKFVWLCNDAKCQGDQKIMRRVRTANGWYLECGHRRIVYDPLI